MRSHSISTCASRCVARSTSRANHVALVFFFRGIIFFRERFFHRIFVVKDIILASRSSVMSLSSRTFSKRLATSSLSLWFYFCAIDAFLDASSARSLFFASLLSFSAVGASSLYSGRFSLVSFVFRVMRVRMMRM